VDWHWGPTKPVRAAMEYLYGRGFLGIHHRVNNRRYFDLIENLLPTDLLKAPNPFNSIESYQKWHVLRRVCSLGIAQINTGDSWGGIFGFGSKERYKIIDRLIKQDQVVPIKIQELGDKTFFIQTADLPILERARINNNPTSSAAIIAPLDNLLWNRKLLEDIFHFRYRWEVYKPKSQREYGYYVLPVLYGDRFVARIEPTFDKKNRTLAVQNWWWEPGIQPTEDMLSTLLECILSFKKYLNAERVQLSDPIKDDATLKWLKNYR
ncbi:MAG: DNA glycosylase AlkZ-like family protein, partial [Anaerolineales bacterium]